jgi:hypothetical protein
MVGTHLVDQLEARVIYLGQSQKSLTPQSGTFLFAWDFDL